MLTLSNHITLADWEIEMSAIRAMGNGGQNVNKVSSAIHLRFDIQRSTLPERYKQRLLALQDSRITKEGVVVLKAQSLRTQEKNREDALARLKELIESVMVEVKLRRPTKPSRNAKIKRVEAKKRTGATKTLRGRVDY